MSVDKRSPRDENGIPSSESLSVEQFQQLFDGMRLVGELVALFKMVQRFRGAGLAYAVGDTGFKLTTLQLADELVLNRVALRVFRTTRSDILPMDDWHQIQGDLKLILSQNDDRYYLENYQRQTVFLEYLLEIIQRLASGRNYSTLSIGSAPVRGATRGLAIADADRELIELVLVEVLQFTETIGRVRAIATCVSVVADPDPRLVDQLKKVDSVIHYQLEAFRQAASDFQHYALKGIPSLVVRQANETQLLQLTGMVKEAIVNRRREKPDSQELFRLATEVIDIHLRIVEETLDYLTSKAQHNLLASQRSS